MDEFTFENTVTLTESQYLAVWGVLNRRPKMIKLVGLAAVGVLLLFTKVTLLLGLLVLGLVVAFLFVPHLLSFGARNTFRRHIYLRDPLTYGVNDHKLWVRGAKIDASVPWSALDSAIVFVIRSTEKRGLVRSCEGHCGKPCPGV